MNTQALVVIVAAATALGACAKSSPGPNVGPLAAAGNTSGSGTSSLESTIRARLDSMQAHGTFYARQLSTGREVAVRADEPMNTASVIKIPVMVLAFRD